MNIEPTPPVQVGTKLAFHMGERYAIYIVTKLTPSGRIHVGPYILDPDLFIRGAKSHFGPHRGEHVTSAIEQRMHRSACLRRLNNLYFNEFPTTLLDEFLQVADKLVPIIEEVE